MLESKIQAAIIKKLEAKFGTTHDIIKIVSCNKPGTPDILVIAKGSMAIEVKQPGKKPEPLQLYRMDQMERKGIKCYVMDDAKQVKEL